MDVSEVYGVLDGRLLGMARRAYQGGIWVVYLANSANENALALGDFRREQASNITEVQRIFSTNGLEFRAIKPMGLPVPDLAIFEGPLPKDSILDNPRVAEKLGELMLLAAERGSGHPRLDSRPYHKTRISDLAGAPMNKKQKTTLIVVIAVMVAMLMVPPFHAILPTGAVTNVGYYLIFDQPTLD